MQPRFGTIVLAGRPNAGKSTLLNALVGSPIAITSPKPQTTREPVSGVVTGGDTQLLFIDTAGLMDPTYALQEAILAQAVQALDRADGVLYLHPAGDGAPPPLESLLPAGTTPRAPYSVVYTKADLGQPAPGPSGHLVSAFTGEGLLPLLAWCRAQAKPGPFRYDPENLSTQPMRFFVAEFVRESAFARLGQELPYAIAVEVDEYRENSDPVYIRATVYVERSSQKGMVIGSGGGTIREIGTLARGRIEQLLGCHCYLDLRVKVLPKWRRSPDALRRFGLYLPR